MNREYKVRGYKLRLFLLTISSVMFLIAQIALPEVRWWDSVAFVLVGVVFWIVHPAIRMRGQLLDGIYYLVHFAAFVILSLEFTPDTHYIYYVVIPVIVAGALDYGLKGAFTISVASSLTYLSLCIFGGSLELYLARSVGFLIFSFLVGLIGEEKIRVEIELNDMEDYAELLVDSIKSGMIVTDTDGRVRSMNESAEEILGYTVSDLRGMRIDRDVAIHKGESPVIRALQDQRPVERIDISMRKKSGIEIPAGVSVYLIRSKSKGDLLGAVEIFRDMSEIKEREMLLQRQERLIAMGEMAAEVAHEIRNPLGGIRGFATLIRRKCEDETICRHIDFIIEGVGSIEKIVNDFLAYARPVEPTLLKLDIHGVIETCLLSSVDGDGIRVVKDFSDRIPEAMFDGEQLKQVFRNLFINAVQAMDGKGELSIKTYLFDKPFTTLIDGKPKVLPPDQTVVIEVTDTGKGIPDEVLERIFNPFFTTKNTGTGLGLAIVHRIIEAHGGTIAVRSRMGEGTTFTIKLPLRNGGDRDVKRTDTDSR